MLISAGELGVARGSWRDEFLDQRCEIEQRQAFAAGEVAGLSIHDTQRADRLPVGSVHGAAGVEADARSADHEGVVLEALVHPRVGNDEQIAVILGDRVGTERGFAARFAEIEPDSRLEPRTVRVHEADPGNGHVEERRGQSDEPVERGLGGRADQVEATEGVETPGFVNGEAFRIHP